MCVRWACTQDELAHTWRCGETVFEGWKYAAATFVQTSLLCKLERFLSNLN